MKKLAALLCVVAMVSACEKTINLTPQGLESRLVVDGSIETNQPPVVFLSTSLDYFSSISADILNNAQVRNARVVISTGNRSHQLKEYSRPLGNGYRLSYYTIDSSNLATAIYGSNGNTYNLLIEVDGGQYTATTTIPNLTKTVDSLWWRKAPGIAVDSNKVLLMARVTDPPGFGNYIRYFTQVNRQPFLPGANSVFDDQVVDGTIYEVQVDQGINRNSPPDFADYGYFNKGDTVTVKFCNIDKQTFDFWRTLEFSYRSIGNPFSSPTTVLNNVNGALGAFCGYSVQYKTLIIPK